MGRPRTRRSFIQTLKDMLNRLLRRDPQPPADPPEVLVPVRRGPRGRSGAAVAEIEEDFDGFFPPRRQ
jgi:hypothetical protein